MDTDRVVTLGVRQFLVSRFPRIPDVGMISRRGGFVYSGLVLWFSGE